MKQYILLFIFLVSAISAEAQTSTMTEFPTSDAKETVTRDIMVRPRFVDNWSVSVAGGAYHSMFYDLKYIIDCSGWAGDIELRKQLTPVIGLGAEVDGYYRMERKERQDPRTLVGANLHINLMNLFGGYYGRSRVFEIEAAVMPAWGHLYRGTNTDIIPDEDYFALKGALDFNFNVGRKRAWTLNLKPAIVCDINSKAPYPGYITRPYSGFRKETTDLQLFVGFTYHFKGKDGKRNFKFAPSRTDEAEIERLNEIVTFLRNDVEYREQQIRDLRRENSQLKQENNALKGLSEGEK